MQRLKTNITAAVCLSISSLCFSQQLSVNDSKAIHTLLQKEFLKNAEEWCFRADGVILMHLNSDNIADTLIVSKSIPVKAAEIIIQKLKPIRWTETSNHRVIVMGIKLALYSKYELEIPYKPYEDDDLELFGGLLTIHCLFIYPIYIHIPQMHDY